MERFYSEDADKDKDKFFDSEEEEESGGDESVYIAKQDLLDVMQMDLAQTELNQGLLGRAVEIARQSWRWFFMSSDAKIEEITSIYKKLRAITDDDPEEEDGEIQSPEK